MNYITEIINTLTILLTGYFGIYALTHEYKDKTGIITRHGKIAIYGILISGTISIIGIGINIKKANDRDFEQKESFKVEIERYNNTIHEIKRLSYPLTDLIIEETYELSDTAPELSDLKNKIDSLIHSIPIDKSTYGVAINNPKGVYDLWENDELVKLSFHKEYEDFPRLNPPSQILCIIDSSIDIQSLNTQRDKGIIDVILKSAIYDDKNLIYKRLTYDIKRKKFSYRIRFMPSSDFSNGLIVSHKDLPNKSLGISLVLPNSHKSWKIKEIIILNKLGYQTKVNVDSFKNLEKSWPKITLYGKIE